MQFGYYNRLSKDGYSAQCERCGNESIWLSEKGEDEERMVMVYPLVSAAPLPVPDMPDEVKADFEEARNVVNASPRAAAALLRLALQKLMMHLHQPGKNINDDIGALVAQGLPTQIQQALDGIRIVGNNAVHPGTIDIEDDTDTALILFNILNYIVQFTITRQKEIERIYGLVPDTTKEAIQRRDSK